MHTFSNSIYAKYMEKQDNSGILLIWAVFRTRQHVDYRMVFWTKSF